MIESANLTVEGYLDDEFLLPLRKGWEYVGPATLAEQPIDKALSSLSGKYYRIYAYDKLNQTWKLYSPYTSLFELNTLSVMVPGQGYVIDMRNDVLWG